MSENENHDDKDADLSERIRRLEDRSALRDLSIDYCRAVDDRDMTALAELFCEDGVFGHADGSETARGRGEVVEFYRDRFAGMGPSVHIAHNQRLSVLDADTAHGTVTGTAQMGIRGRTIVGAIRYEDDYRKVDGRWLFAHRSLRFWYLLPIDELAHRLSESHRRRWPGEPMQVQLPETLDTWQAFYGTAP